MKHENELTNYDKKVERKIKKTEKRLRNVYKKIKKMHFKLVCYDCYDGWNDDLNAPLGDMEDIMCLMDEQGYGEE